MSPARQLEELAMNAWPAEVIQTVEGWRLRFTQGVSRRANSVWSNQPSQSTPIAQRIAQAEAFYSARRAKTCFHIGPLCPPELDAALAERGYTPNGHTRVQVAAVETVLAKTSNSADAQVELHPTPSRDWEAVAWPTADLAPAVRRGILARIGPCSICALARRGGRGVAAGLGVFERGHVGVFSMRTEEAERQHGLASAILHALTRWGQELGAETAYLQVEEDNPVAQRVYARAGFRTAYAYHYRSRDPE